MTPVLFLIAIVLWVVVYRKWARHAPVRAQVIKDWLGNAWNYGQTKYYNTLSWTWRAARNTLIYVGGYLLLLELALLMGFDWPTLLILLVGAFSSFFFLWVARLAYHPLKEAAEGFEAWGKAIFEKVPLAWVPSSGPEVVRLVIGAAANLAVVPFTIPLNILAGIFRALGGVASAGSRVLRNLTLALAGAHFGLLFLTFLVLNDLTTGADLLDSWSALLLTLIGTAVLTLGALGGDEVLHRKTDQAQTQKPKRPFGLAVFGLMNILLLVGLLVAYWNPGVAKAMGKNARNAQTAIESYFNYHGVAGAQTAQQFAITNAPIKIQYILTRDGKFIPDPSAPEVPQGTYCHILDYSTKAAPLPFAKVNPKTDSDPYWALSYQRADTARWVPLALLNVIEFIPQLESPIQPPAPPQPPPPAVPAVQVPATPLATVTIPVINGTKEPIFLFWRDEKAQDRLWSIGGIPPGRTWNQTSYPIPGSWVVKDAKGNVLRTFPATEQTQIVVKKP